MNARLFFIATIFSYGGAVHAEIDPHARVCVLVFTQTHGVITTSYSCDGSKNELLPNQGRTMIEIQSHALKLFMGKMLVPKSCSAVNTTEDKQKAYQFTCVLYP